MRYDKQNKKFVALQTEIDRLRTENAKASTEAKAIKEILDSTFHEVRRFSAQLSKLAERLSRETEDQPLLQTTALSAFYTAGMMASRLAYTDIELNPKALESQTTVRSGIYKKFDKARRILTEEARDHGINIRLEGESRTEIEALPVFELLPFVLLDNGIKYSPRNQNVAVQFESVGGRQCVTIRSIGPLATRTELPTLFDKYVRGAQSDSLPGQGLGLYLAKRVCDYHGVRIRAESGPNVQYQLNGKDYAEFRVILQF